jgi:hypothetical protein
LLQVGFTTWARFDPHRVLWSLWVKTKARRCLFHSFEELLIRPRPWPLWLMSIGNSGAWLVFGIACLRLLLGTLCGVQPTADSIVITGMLIDRQADACLTSSATDTAVMDILGSAMRRMPFESVRFLEIQRL